MIKGEFYKQIHLKFCHIKKGEIVSYISFELIISFDITKT